MSTAWDGIVASFGGIATIATLTAPKVCQKSDLGHAMLHIYLYYVGSHWVDDDILGEHLYSHCLNEVSVYVPFTKTRLWSPGGPAEDFAWLSPSR